jgi:Uma2 family endonuclease
MGMAHPLYYSAEMVRALPDDGNRYETVHGELLVTPAPTVWHQTILQRLNESLVEYLRTQEIGGNVLHSPADISWSDDTLVQPDLFVADINEVRTLDWANIKTLLLVIEVLSPSTARYDRFTKRRLYQEAKVSTYWVVDPNREIVEAWTPEAEVPRTVKDTLIWRPAGSTESLDLDVKTLFEPI